MKGFVFFLLLTALPLGAEQGPALILEPPLPREGEQFSLSYRVLHARAPEVSASSESFPDALTLVSGPYISPARQADPETGEERPCTEVRYRLRAARAGRSVLGPLSYRIRGTEYFTRDMILELARSRDSLVPFELVWRPLSDEVYEGQAVAALLEMRGLTEITVPEAVAVSQPGSALFEEVKGLGGISSVSAGGRELYRMVVSSWMLTPSSAGRLSLPSARVKALGLTLESAPCAIRVRSLPPEVKSSGAVGTFSLSSRVDKEEALPGETLRLFIRVEGEGNLNYLRAPLPVFEDILVTGPETSSQLEPFDFGYRGWVEWAFLLSPQKEGAFTLRVPAFSWIDPQSGFPAASREISLRIRVRGRQPGDGPPPSSDLRKILNSREVLACEPWDLYARPYLYAFTLPCVYVFVLGIMKARRKISVGVLGVFFAAFFLLGASREDGLLRQKALALVDEGAAAYENENYGEALKLFFAASENLPASPGVYYNLGQSKAALGNAAESVFWLRMAAFGNPSAAFIRTRLFEAEKDFGITHAASVPWTHPDVFFAFFTASFFLACLLPWLFRRKTGGGTHRRFLFVCLTALFFAAAFSAAAAAYQASSRGREWGVVSSGGAPLRKIPRADSSEWITLAEGTAVDIVSRSGGFALISTGSGIEGWMEERTLIENTGERLYGTR
jgi:hypothetical protein